MASKPSLSVEIFGHTYKIKGTADPEALARVASYVDSKMRIISEQVATVDPVKIAILAALNIADEHLQTMETLSQGLPQADSSFDDKVLELQRLLDSCLDE